MSSQNSSRVHLSLDEKRLLDFISKNGLSGLKPKRAGDNIVYEGLEAISKELGEEKVQELLKKLTASGHLAEKLQDSAIFCPHCNSIHIFSRYNCLKCQSYNVRRVQMIEHLFCGYIGDIREFGNAADLICPKCKSNIGNYYDAKTTDRVDKRRSIKVIGSTFECEKCGSKFEKPQISHTCERCGATFTYRDAIYERVPSYESTNKKQELTFADKIAQPLRAASDVFSSKGYHVDLDTKLTGKSGVEQHFDLIATKGENQTLVDVSIDGNQNDVVSLLGKKMDLDSKSIILLDLSGNELLASLGKSYNIEVLDGRDEKHLEKLVGILTDAEKGQQNVKGINPFRRRKPN
jgi:hypothetical protein